MDPRREPEVNIFVLGDNASPITSAQYQCDKHIPKMTLETAQLLSGVWDDGPYKRSHYNHPCAVWVRTSPANYEWTIEHGRALLDEYTFRYGKTHKCETIWSWCVQRYNKYTVSPFLTNSNKTPFAQAMPEHFKGILAVDAYRRYYLTDKARFAKWQRGRHEPYWWPSKGREA